MLSLVLSYFLQDVALERVGAEVTAAIWSEVGLHVDHVGRLPLQGDYVKALPDQVVTRHKGSGLALAAGPSLTGEGRGVV